MIVWYEESPILWLPSYSENDSFSYFNQPVEIFEDDTRQELLTEAYKFLFKFLREFVKRENYCYLNFLENPYFLNEFYTEISESKDSFVGIIDLRADIATIRSAIRKSFKSLLNWGEKNLRIEIINSENFDGKWIEEFREFHIRVSGRQTRRDATWQIQGEMVRQGQAFMVLAYHENILISAGLYLFGSKEIYYGVGVYDRDMMRLNLPLAHYPLFRAIQEAKHLQLDTFNFGDIGNNHIDEKENQISRFKKGFVSQCKIQRAFKIKLL